MAFVLSQQRNSSDINSKKKLNKVRYTLAVYKY